MEANGTIIGHELDTSDVIIARWDRHTLIDSRYSAHNGVGPQRYWGPSSAFGADSDVERSRPGSSRIAYPVRADMMDPPMVRSNEPA